MRTVEKRSHLELVVLVLLAFVEWPVILELVDVVDSVELLDPLGHFVSLHGGFCGRLGVVGGLVVEAGHGLDAADLNVLAVLGPQGGIGLLGVGCEHLSVREFRGQPLSEGRDLLPLLASVNKLFVLEGEKICEIENCSGQVDFPRAS